MVIVRHELALVQNKDLDVTYLTVDLWRVFLGVVSLPTLILFHSALGSASLSALGLSEFWLELAALGVLVLLIHHDILRERELRADARATARSGDSAAAIAGTLLGAALFGFWLPWVLSLRTDEPISAANGYLSPGKFLGEAMHSGYLLACLVRQSPGLLQIGFVGNPFVASLVADRYRRPRCAGPIRGDVGGIAALNMGRTVHIDIVDETVQRRSLLITVNCHVRDSGSI
jgi:hypothetical protein